ncbi:hypothetical protein [uncultured Thiodictyon sp.]|uniref:hypothetical protein n=1 Tax=uncultured Thiodictyon sp. TaxID=1846217 RepID=UPI0025CF3BC4|nr:hypothetical protein [uncultured Thiodictyon sp.]
MLILSREARLKVSRHAWNVFPLEAFGYLLGKTRDYEIYAALPFSKTQYWGKYDDRWSVVPESIDKARMVGQLFALDVVGFYASTDVTQRDSFPLPSFGRFADIVMLYQTICCPSCSWCSYFKDGRWLTPDEDYVTPHGRRIRPEINQKRILKAWRMIHGPIDYSNRSGPDEDPVGRVSEA